MRTLRRAAGRLAIEAVLALALAGPASLRAQRPAELPAGTRVRVTTFPGAAPLVGTLLGDPVGESLHLLVGDRVVPFARRDVARLEASRGPLSAGARAARASASPSAAWRPSR